MNIFILYEESSFENFSNYNSIDEIINAQTDFSFLDFSYNIIILNINSYKNTIKELSKITDICVINLCDGISSNLNEIGENVIIELSNYNIPFTGATLKTYLTTKLDIKKFTDNTPNYLIIDKNKDFDFTLKTFPLIMKPIYGCGSIGITKESIINNKDELSSKIINYEYNEFIIEEFIKGREFSVFIIENSKNPIILEPYEYIYDDEFMHYYLKWNDYKKISFIPLLDSNLVNRLIELTKETFIKMNLDGYARFDIKLDSNTDKLHILDINPNCELFYPKKDYGCVDCMLSNSKIMNHLEFVHFIIKSRI